MEIVLLQSDTNHGTTEQFYSPLKFRLVFVTDTQTTAYRYESRTDLLPCFASTNSGFVTKNHQKLKVCNLWIYLIYEILISNSYFIASQSGTTRQTVESWCSRRLSIPSSEASFTG
jgi:hypothetical protein